MNEHLCKSHNQYASMSCITDVDGLSSENLSIDRLVNTIRLYLQLYKGKYSHIRPYFQVMSIAVAK